MAGPGLAHIYQPRSEAARLCALGQRAWGVRSGSIIRLPMRTGIAQREAQLLSALYTRARPPTTKPAYTQLRFDFSISRKDAPGTQNIVGAPHPHRPGFRHAKPQSSRFAAEL